VAAGPDARNFDLKYSMQGAETFGLAMGDLRSQLGFYVGALATQYGLPVEMHLRRILPPQPTDEDDDLSWIPGF